MKAIRCTDFGPPEDLEFVEVEDPVAGAGEVVVETVSAGVGYVDGLLIQGLYQVKPPLPYFPGSEFAGRVISVGDGVTHLKPGMRVMGLAATGAFAEQVRVPAMVCVPLPDGLDDAVAGGFFINYATALYGLRDCGKLEAGENLLILGASGGVGMAAIAVAKAMGARVIAAASSTEKREAAVAAGADDAVDYTKDDWRDDLKALVGKDGLNMVYDPVGGDMAEPALRSLAPGGRYLVVGFAGGAIPKIGLNLVLLKRCSIVGVDWGGEARANPAINVSLMGTLMGWVADGTLTPAPVTARPFAEAREALRDQLSRKTLGKLVLIF